MKKILVGLYVLTLILGLAINAMADPIGSGSATFVAGQDSLIVTLTDTVVDPVSIAQNLSGLSFSLSGGQTLGYLTSSSGYERSVAAGGTFTTTTSVVDTKWKLDSITGGLFLHVLGTPTAPEHTIIGDPGTISKIYDLANNSIARNGPHNPFLYGPVTFYLSVPGVTSSTTIPDGSVSFFYGTTAANNPVPEPSTMLLLGSGLVGIWGFRKTVRKR
jgi:hypothetical protein